MPDNIKRQQIIHEAAKLLAQSGYTTTSMQQIADQVGTTKAALYYYFESKEAVIKAIFDNDYQHIKEDFDKIFLSNLSDYKKIEKLIQRLIETKIKNPEFQLLSHIGNSPKDRRSIAGYVRSYKKKFFSLMRRSLKKTNLFKNCPTYLHLTETLIMGIVLSAIIHSKKHAEQVTRSFITILKKMEKIHDCK
ncbi:MAG: TetR/AcrR family transcriptional regulator [Patescibacteria group bacterium]